MDNLLFWDLFLFILWWLSDWSICQTRMPARSFLQFFSNNFLPSLDIMLKLMSDGKLWKIRVIRLIINCQVIKIAWVFQCLGIWCSWDDFEIDDPLHSVFFEMPDSFDELHIFNHIGLERSPSFCYLALIWLWKLLIDFHSKRLQSKMLIGLTVGTVKMLLRFRYLSRLCFNTSIEGICLSGNVEDQFIRLIVSINEIFILIEYFLWLFGCLDDIHNLLVQASILTDL